MIKNFIEMSRVDVMPFCEKRKAKDENGRQVEIPYLPWVKCLTLLYENGAEHVSYKPLESEDGSPVFTTGFETTDKNGRVTGNYFVKVQVEVDDKKYLITYPIMNGTAVVYRDTLNQLRISNSIQRAFVKCIAVETGLGISLWEKDDETSDDKRKRQDDDVFSHNPMMVKEAIEILMTDKMSGGKTKDNILAEIGVNEKQFDLILKCLNNAAYIIEKLRGVAK